MRKLKLFRILEVHENHGDYNPNNTPCEGFGWEMSNRFIEFIFFPGFFVTFETIERSGMESCLKSNIDGIVDDNHRKDEGDGEEIRKYSVFDPDGRCSARHEGTVDTRHTTGSESLRNREGSPFESVYPLDNNRNNPCNCRDENNVFRKNMHTPKDSKD